MSIEEDVRVSDPQERLVADASVLEGLQAQERAAAPILYAGAEVLTLDPVVGDLPVADVLVGGPTVVGVGPGLPTAAEDDGMFVVVDHLAVLGLRSRAAGGWGRWRWGCPRPSRWSRRRWPPTWAPRSRP